MALHRSTGRWQLGLALALITAGCWATLPAALKIVLADIDAVSLTWLRFVIAAAALGLWLGFRGRLRAYRGLSGRGWILLAVAAIMLIGNYLLYLIGVDRTTPGNAQLLIQAAPLLMALGGIFVFGERYNRWQWLGMVAIVLGLGLFLVDQGGNPGIRDYRQGSLIVLLAALAWALYALAQKQLLNDLGSAQILLFIYVAAALILLPLVDSQALLALTGLPLLLALYASANTLIAYGAFAEALAHWEASRVSAILATTPLLAVLCVELVHAMAPQLLAPERIHLLGWIGAVLVVIGSGLASLARKRALELPTATVLDSDDPSPPPSASGETANARR